MNCPKCGLMNTGNMAVGLAMPQCMCHWQSPTPPRQPLTDEEIFACENSVPDEAVTDRDWCIHFARAIEAAHGIMKGGAA